MPTASSPSWRSSERAKAAAIQAAPRERRVPSRISDSLEIQTAELKPRLAIRERLAASDRGNSARQRELAVSYAKLTLVHLRLVDADQALIEATQRARYHNSVGRCRSRQFAMAKGAHKA